MQKINRTRNKDSNEKLKKIYNINKINELLYDYKCKTLNKGE